MSFGVDPFVTPALPGVDKYHLLVIGVEHYAHYDQLPNAVIDAANVATLLTEKYSFEKPKVFDDLRDIDPDYRDPGYPDSIPVFNSAQSCCLYNKNATKKTVKAKLREISGMPPAGKKIGADDALLIYFAGHGISSNGNYFLLMQDSDPNDPDTWLGVSEIAEFFNNYPVQLHTRHLLLVLDSCFAGTASAGTTTSYSGFGSLSRQVLTSCTEDQTANDGVIFNGSDFANAFIATLKDIQENSFKIDDTMRPIKRWLEVNTEPDIPGQKISLTKMTNMTNGNDGFPFKRRSGDRPDIDHLRESIFDDLDFLPQRSDLDGYYKSYLKQLNIITTSGNNPRAHQMLSKVVLRWFVKSEEMFFKPGVCNVPAAISLDLHGDEDIFEIVSQNIKTPGTDYNQASVFRWFMDQAKTTNPDWSGLRHTIIRIGFQHSPERRIVQISKFCDDFSRMHKEWLRNLPDNEKGYYGNILILISDSSAAGLDFQSGNLIAAQPMPEYNFIPIQRIKNMVSQHIKTWLREFRNINQSPKLHVLKDKVFDECFVKSEYGHDEVVESFCKYCGFEEHEINTLNEQLYDYNKKFLI